MQQKTSVVASLIHNPEILFLDEPTVGLDPTTKRVLWDLMLELNDEGKSIILCSHDMYEVDKICDSINIIDSGKVVANNTPQGLKDQLLKTKEETNKKDDKEEKDDSLSSFINMISGLDVDKISDGLNGMKKILNILSEITVNDDVSSFTSARRNQRPYKRDDD